MRDTAISAQKPTGENRCKTWETSAAHKHCNVISLGAVVSRLIHYIFVQGQRFIFNKQVVIQKQISLRCVLASFEMLKTDFLLHTYILPLFPFFHANSLKENNSCHQQTRFLFNEYKIYLRFFYFFKLRLVFKC